MQLVTMTDLGYLPQTLTLHRSLSEHARGARLTVLCMDEASAAFLRARELPGLDLASLPDLEAADPELAATRAHRTWSEYCWTATPAFCAARLAQLPVGSVLTWVDSDVAFHRDPRALLDALGDGSVLLTPHAYRRAYPGAMPASGLSELYGRYNGGTIAFRNDAEGRGAAELWRSRSIAWCRDACEPGRFGNQLHLDDFPERFAGVRALSIPGGVLGPWNGGGFVVRRGAGGPTADGEPVVAYHYQSLRLRHRRLEWRNHVNPNVFPVLGCGLPLEARVEPHYRLTVSEQHVFWRDHVARLARSVAEVLAADPRHAKTLLPVPSAAERATARREFLRLQRTRAGWGLLPSLSGGG